jgi:transcriptional regulator with XRE-family HTH domain
MTRAVTKNAAKAQVNANERVAAQIRAFMAARKMRSADLAQLLNITPYTANRRVQGEGTPFDFNDVEAIAGWLGVPVAYIVDPGAHQYTP